MTDLEMLAEEIRQAPGFYRAEHSMGSMEPLTDSEAVEALVDIVEQEAECDVRSADDLFKVLAGIIDGTWWIP